MENQIVYFIEKNGIKRYKCDTAWTLSENPEHAKVHTPDHERLFGSYLSTMKFFADVNDQDLEYLKNKIIGNILGYSTFSEDQLKNKVSLKKGCIFMNTRYLYIITDVQELDKIIYEDYRITDRDNKIKSITNEKHVD